MGSFRTLLLLLLPLLLAGCSHVLSPPALERVDHNLTFKRVKAAPEEHLGTTLLLGGVILSCAAEQESSTLEIFRWDLDQWGEPIALDEEAGRFLVQVERFLDPALYSRGRMITLTAHVAGKEEREWEYGIRYTYPLLSGEELYLWPTPLRYMLYTTMGPYAPVYIPPPPGDHPNPYDHGFAPFPYTPYWLRR
ncbi:MAG: hypothetical protein C0621_07180 [Desulfuromonas sp.]|nr:MAG: hypothetical protein C0621_07180 [Desulfuromonas sp.]